MQQQYNRAALAGVLQENPEPVSNPFQPHNLAELHKMRQPKAIPERRQRLFKIPAVQHFRKVLQASNRDGQPTDDLRGDRRMRNSLQRSALHS